MTDTLHSECGEPGYSGFNDALFREKRKHGAYRLVVPPRIEAALVDTHAHLHMLADPACALARCALWNIEFVCSIVDIAEDDLAVFDQLRVWRKEATGLCEPLLERSRSVCAVALAGRGASEALLQADVRQAAAQQADVQQAGVQQAGAQQAGIQQVGTQQADAQQVEKPQLKLVVPNGVKADDLLPRAFAPFAIPHLRIALGCHPHNASRYDAATEEALLTHLADPWVCAIGEIGLDYHYDLSPRSAQREVFARQIQLAHETGLPIALHIREAHDDALAVLEAEGWPEAGVLLHCYTADAATLRPWIEAGCFVAFGGALTFNRSENIRKAACLVPEDRLLTETDSPYMAPMPLRGSPCEPAYMIFTADRLARLRGCDAPEDRQRFFAQLARNAYGLLDRPLTQWQQAQVSAQNDLAAQRKEVTR